MSITLTPEEQQWLQAEVAAGRFPSIEAAVRAALADFKTVLVDDQGWARSPVDRTREWMTPERSSSLLEASLKIVCLFGRRDCCSNPRH